TPDGFHHPPALFFKNRAKALPQEVDNRVARRKGGFATIRVDQAPPPTRYCALGTPGDVQVSGTCCRLIGHHSRRPAVSSSPAIRLSDCTAAPLAPLPRLSSTATRRACVPSGEAKTWSSIA